MPKRKQQDDEAMPDITTTPTEALLEERPVEPEFSIGLAQPGEDKPDRARRFSCPNCGAKHDAVRTDAAKDQQAGTWTVPLFVCVAGCGYSGTGFPIT